MNKSAIIFAMAISEINLSDLVTPEEYDQRACKGVNPNIFYPPDPEDIADGVALWPTEAMARRICQSCVIGDECLMVGIANGERDGIRQGIDLRTEIS